MWPNPQFPAVTAFTTSFFVQWLGKQATFWKLLQCLTYRHMYFFNIKCFNYCWQKPVKSDNENRFTDDNIGWKSFDAFQPNFAFYIETSYLICSANQLTGFYTKSTPVWNCLNCLKFDRDQSKPSQYLLI